MIKINRRLKLNEAMNFCERHGFVYNVTYRGPGKYEFTTQDPGAFNAVVKHLEEWEAHE